MYTSITLSVLYFNYKYDILIKWQMTVHHTLLYFGKLSSYNMQESNVYFRTTTSSAKGTAFFNLTIRKHLQNSINFVLTYSTTDCSHLPLAIVITSELTPVIYYILFAIFFRLSPVAFLLHKNSMYLFYNYLRVNKEHMDWNENLVTKPDDDLPLDKWQSVVMTCSE